MEQQMTSIDWMASATLQQREDGGSDMFYGFETIGEGPLAAMVARVLEMSPHDRARVVLDVKGMGTLDVNQIVTLSRREDFPHSEGA